MAEDLKPSGDITTKLIKNNKKSKTICRKNDCNWSLIIKSDRPDKTSYVRGFKTFWRYYY